MCNFNINVSPTVRQIIHSLKLVDYPQSTCEQTMVEVFNVYNVMYEQQKRKNEHTRSRGYIFSILNSTEHKIAMAQTN